ncbi:MAG: hypothetical protein ACERKD_19675 [Prolixibacteraceae bacterium]
MKNDTKSCWGNCEGNVSEFMFSDLELGIFQNEMLEYNRRLITNYIVFNRLEMIIEINDLIKSN